MADLKLKPDDGHTAPRHVLRRLLPRWSFSTWLLVLLAAIVLFFVEVLGRRIGAMKYAHGWPFVYLPRDYGGFSASGPSAQTGPLEDLWAQGRMPAFCEEAMNPWSWSGGKRLWQLAADLAFALSLLIAAGTLREAWRRRHPPRAAASFSIQPPDIVDGRAS